MMSHSDNANTESSLGSQLPNADTESGPRLLTYQQAAEVLQISARTVWTLVDDGRLKAVRFGHTVRIDCRDLEAFIETAKDKKTVSCDGGYRPLSVLARAARSRNKGTDAAQSDPNPGGAADDH